MATGFNSQLAIHTRLISSDGPVDDIAVARNVTDLLATQFFYKILEVVRGRRIGYNAGS